MSDLTEVLDALHAAQRRGVRIVAEPLGKSLLSAVGVAVPDGQVARNTDEVERAAASCRLPVMVKTVLEDVAHKSELGGVSGPFHTREEAEGAAREMLDRFDAPALLEHCHEGGVECFVGLTVDGPYGPVISVGLGGLWVEVFRDVQHRRAPLDQTEARQMLMQLRAAPLLRGERGRTLVDLDALAETVATLSRLVTVPEVRDMVSELEINPLSAPTTGAPVALDCALTLTPSPEADIELGEGKS